MGKAANGLSVCQLPSDVATGRPGSGLVKVGQPEVDHCGDLVNCRRHQAVVSERVLILRGHSSKGGSWASACEHVLLHVLVLCTQCLLQAGHTSLCRLSFRQCLARGLCFVPLTQPLRHILSLICGLPTCFSENSSLPPSLTQRTGMLPHSHVLSHCLFQRSWKAGSEMPFAQESGRISWYSRGGHDAVCKNT